MTSIPDITKNKNSNFQESMLQNPLTASVKNSRKRKKTSIERIVSLFSQYIQHFIGLLYPNVCMACGNSLFKHEYHLCTYCIYHLPKTNFHFYKENPVDKLFWGRVNIQHASAFYYFNKGGRVQHLMHNLKYNGQKELGERVGELYGLELRKVESFAAVDYVIPVPLHEKKLKKRGYNQSEWFARGIAESIGSTCNTDILVRAEATETQTKKSRFERWKNVESVFKISDIHSLENKSILLVDDVITTGATLEACAHKILQARGAKVYVAAIACA